MAQLPQQKNSLPAYKSVLHSVIVAVPCCGRCPTVPAAGGSGMQCDKLFRY